MKETSEQVAVVTGANRGIGFEICRGLARLGIHTLLTGRDERKAQAAAEKLAAELIRKHPELKMTKVMVSEAGASVYSASELASREMPDLDVSLRGAVSIGRRLQDPLAELLLGGTLRDGETRFRDVPGAVWELFPAGTGLHCQKPSLHR